MHSNLADMMCLFNSHCCQSLSDIGVGLVVPRLSAYDVRVCARTWPSLQLSLRDEGDLIEDSSWLGVFHLMSNQRLRARVYRGPSARPLPLHDEYRCEEQDRRLIEPPCQVMQTSSVVTSNPKLCVRVVWAHLPDRFFCMMISDVMNKIVVR
jgi:hypothetical protein